MRIDRQMLVAAVLAGTIALVGCGGSSSSSGSGKFEKDETTQEQVAESVPEPEPAAEPESDGLTLDADDAFIRPEFAQAMQEYEDFYRSYVDFMKRYAEDPTNLDLIQESADMIRQEGEMMASFDAIDESTLTPAELALYYDTHADIIEMLGEVLESM